MDPRWMLHHCRQLLLRRLVMGHLRSVFEAIMDTEEELRAMDAAVAEWLEKMLHLLALKRQIHCYRCGEPYYKEDDKQHVHLKADCPKKASQADLNGEPLKAWAKNKPWAEKPVPAYNWSGQRSLHTLKAQAEIEALKAENTWIKSENDLVHNYLHEHIDQQEHLQCEVDMLTLQAGMTHAPVQPVPTSGATVTVRLHTMRRPQLALREVQPAEFNLDGKFELCVHPDTYDDIMSGRAEGNGVGAAQ